MSDLTRKTVDPNPQRERFETVDPNPQREQSLEHISEADRKRKALSQARSISARARSRDARGRFLKEPPGPVRPTREASVPRIPQRAASLPTQGVMSPVSALSHATPSTQFASPSAPRAGNENEEEGTDVRRAGSGPLLSATPGAAIHEDLRGRGEVSSMIPISSVSGWIEQDQRLELSPDSYKPGGKVIAFNTAEFTKSIMREAAKQTAMTVADGARRAMSIGRSTADAVVRAATPARKAVVQEQQDTPFGNDKLRAQVLQSENEQLRKEIEAAKEVEQGRADTRIKMMQAAFDEQRAMLLEELERRDIANLEAMRKRDEEHEAARAIKAVRAAEMQD